METGPAGIAIIKEWEKFYANAYDDGEGVWTIGWGTIKWDMKTPVKRGDKITREEADRQLLKEVHRIEDAINSTVKVPLTQCEFDSLISLFYNIGIGWCTGHGHDQATLIKRLNKGDYVIASEFLKFKKGANTGKTYDGLLKRRKEEAKLWLTADEHVVIPAADVPHVDGDLNEDGAPVAPMPQAVAPEKGSMVQAAKESWTIRSAAAGAAAGVYQGWTALFSTVKEAGVQVSDIQTATGPFEALFSALKVNMVAISAGIVVAACAVAIIRRVQAAREGKVG
jgi:lysozyme